MTVAARRVRRERGEPPVLPAREERVRRRTDRRVLHEQIGIVRDVEARAVRIRSGSRGRAPDRARRDAARDPRVAGRSATARTRDTPRPLRPPLRACCGSARTPSLPDGRASQRRRFGSCSACARDRLERRCATEPHGRAGRRVRRARARRSVPRAARGRIEIHLVPEPARDRRVRARIAGFVAVAEERREQRQACRRSRRRGGAAQSASRRNVPRSPVVESGIVEGVERREDAPSRPRPRRRDTTRRGEHRPDVVPPVTRDADVVRAVRKRTRQPRP